MKEIYNNNLRKEEIEIDDNDFFDIEDRSFKIEGEKMYEKIGEIIRNIPEEGLCFHGTAKDGAENIKKRGFVKWGEIDSDPDDMEAEEQEGENFAFIFTPENREGLLEFYNNLEAEKEPEEKQLIKNEIIKELRYLFATLRATIISAFEYGQQYSEDGEDIPGKIYNKTIDKDVMPSLLIFNTPKEINSYEEETIETTRIPYKAKLSEVTPFDVLRFPNQKVEVEAVISLDESDLDIIHDRVDKRLKNRAGLDLEKLVEEEMDRVIVNKVVRFLIGRYKNDAGRRGGSS